MKEIIFAGFGGQGVLTSGLILAYMAAEKDFNAVWMPAYGPTMRGGKANCVVKIGDSIGERIGSPIMGKADLLVAMNEPSLDYIAKCKKGAIILANSNSIAADYVYPEGYKIVRFDCVEPAYELGNVKSQNLVALGAVIRLSGYFEKEYALEKLCQFFDEKGKGKYNEINRKAFLCGYDGVSLD